MKNWFVLCVVYDLFIFVFMWVDFLIECLDCVFVIIWYDLLSNFYVVMVLNVNIFILCFFICVCSVGCYSRDIKVYVNY